MKTILGAALVLCSVPSIANAGAWTLPENQTQLIETTTYSYATVNFDSHGNPTEPVVYQKLLTSLYGEYGWNDWLTLVAEPEYAHAIAGAPNKLIQQGNDFAIAAGARVRLFSDIGQVSVQALVKSAGAFDMTTSFDQAGGEEFEVRVLYGTNFQLFGHDGFIDAELAQRFILGRRPDETAADFTIGYSFKKTQVLLQSFNIISTGSGRPPYSFFRSHKIAISSITPLWRMFRLQTGSYISPGGQNALAEKGLFAAIWVSF